MLVAYEVLFMAFSEYLCPSFSKFKIKRKTALLKTGNNKKDTFLHTVGKKTDKETRNVLVNESFCAFFRKWIR